MDSFVNETLRVALNVIPCIDHSFEEDVTIVEFALIIILGCIMSFLSFKMKQMTARVKREYNGVRDDADDTDNDDADDTDNNV